jgi:hypothetical protein
MTDFELPADLSFNRGPVTDPGALAEERGAASWLFLCGTEFAAEGGLSYDQVRAAVAVSGNVVSDPPRTLDLDIARAQIAALDELPRPTLVTCRAGPRSSAAVYLYAGLKAGASPDDVLARAEADGAPFTGKDDLRAWVTQGLTELRDT